MDFLKHNAENYKKRQRSRPTPGPQRRRVDPRRRAAFKVMTMIMMMMMKMLMNGCTATHIRRWWLCWNGYCSFSMQWIYWETEYWCGYIQVCYSTAFALFIFFGTHRYSVVTLTHFIMIIKQLQNGGLPYYYNVYNYFPYSNLYVPPRAASKVTAMARKSKFRRSDTKMEQFFQWGITEHVHI